MYFQVNWTSKYSFEDCKTDKAFAFCFHEYCTWCKPHSFLLSLFQTFTCKVGFDGLCCSVCHSLLVHTNFIQALNGGGSENGYPGMKVLDVGLLWGTIKEDGTVVLFTSNKHFKKYSKPSFCSEKSYVSQYKSTQMLARMCSCKGKNGDLRNSS